MGALKSIMGSRLDEEEMDCSYQEFLQKASDSQEDPQMAEKVRQLYSLMQTASDPEKKAIAQWALTYVFDDQDLMHDTIPGLGMADDMIVIDSALRFLRQ